MEQEQPTKKKRTGVWKGLFFLFAAGLILVANAIDLQNQDGYILINTVDNETWNLNFNNTKLPPSFATTWNYSGRPAISPLDDNSGNNNTLTNVNNVLYDSQFPAYSFSGTGSQYLNVSNSASFPFINLSSTDGFTVSGWMYDNGTAIYTAPIFLQIRTGTDRFVIGKRTSTQAVCGYWDGASYVNRKSGTAPLNQWFFALCIWNSTNSTLYVNSAIVTDTFTPGIGGTLGTSIGGDRGTRTLNGSISDVRVWNRSLTPAEVATVYANGTVSDGLVAWYPFRVVSEIPSGEYASLVVPVTPEPPAPTPGTFWRDWDTNETYIRTPAATWEVVS